MNTNFDIYMEHPDNISEIEEISDMEEISEINTSCYDSEDYENCENYEEKANVDDGKNNIDIQSLELNSEHTNDNCIDAIRYALEIYVNSVKTTKDVEILRWFAYYLPDYGIEIMVRSYSENSVIMGKDLIEVHKCDGPKNKYTIPSSKKVYEAELQNVKISKEWVEECVKLYANEEKTRILKNQLFFRAPNVKTKTEIIEDVFNSGMKCFESHDFSLGREKFLKCLEMLNGNKIDERLYLSHYNIACCYARENNTEFALVSLANAVSNGYSNWAHTIADKDMSTLLHIPHFVEIIKIMMTTNPIRRLIAPEVPKELNIIDVFLKKNNLEHLEKNITVSVKKKH